jgi:hypothetical protein
MPDAEGCALYAQTEALEVLQVMLDALRSGDLRARQPDERSPIGREIAQLVFMQCSTASTLGIALEDPREAPSTDPVAAILECIGDMNSVARWCHAHDARPNGTPLWIAQVLRSSQQLAISLALSFGVNVKDEIDAWMAERHEVAWS